MIRDLYKDEMLPFVYGADVLEKSAIKMLLELDIFSVYESKKDGATLYLIHTEPQFRFYIKMSDEYTYATFFGLNSDRQREFEDQGVKFDSIEQYCSYSDKTVEEVFCMMLMGIENIDEVIFNMDKISV